MAQGRLEEARRAYEHALAVQTDSASWRGYPYYPLGLAPIRSCLLRLELARVDKLEGKEGSMGERIEEVLTDCPSTGAVAERIAALTGRAE